MNSLHLFLALAAVVVGCASALECGANNCYSGDTTALGGAGRGTCNTVTGNCTCNKGSGHGQTAFDEIVQKYGLDYANSFKNGTDGVYTWPYAHQFLWQYTGRDCQTRKLKVQECRKGVGRSVGRRSLSWFNCFGTQLLHS